MDQVKPEPLTLPEPLLLVENNRLVQVVQLAKVNIKVYTSQSLVSCFPRVLYGPPRTLNYLNHISNKGSL